MSHDARDGLSIFTCDIGAVLSTFEDRIVPSGQRSRHIASFCLALAVLLKLRPYGFLSVKRVLTIRVSAASVLAALLFLCIVAGTVIDRILHRGPAVAVEIDPAALDFGTAWAQSRFELVVPILNPGRAD